MTIPDPRPPMKHAWPCTWCTQERLPCPEGHIFRDTVEEQTVTLAQMVPKLMDLADAIAASPPPTLSSRLWDLKRKLALISWTAALGILKGVQRLVRRIQRWSK